MTMVAPYTQGALAGFGRRRKALMRAYPPRRRGMGQSFWSDVTSLFSPTPGGGYVVTGTNSDGSQNVNYTDSSGNPQTMTVPAGASVDQSVQAQIPSTVAYDTTGLATAAASTITSPFASIPSWVWLVVGVGGLMLLMGFSGVGKLIPASNPRRYRRHNRRRSRARS